MTTRRSFDEGNARQGVPDSFLRSDPLFGEGCRLSVEEIKPVERKGEAMTSELKAAAERYSTWSLADYIENDDEYDRGEDQDTLSDAMVARLAADEQREREDAEPITDRLLAEFGPEKQFGEALFVSANFSVRDATIRVSGVEGDAKGFQICFGELCFITTRGQLRKMLEALRGGGT